MIFLILITFFSEQPFPSKFNIRGPAALGERGQYSDSFQNLIDFRE